MAPTLLHSADQSLQLNIGATRQSVLHKWSKGFVILSLVALTFLLLLRPSAWSIPASLFSYSSIAPATKSAAALISSTHTSVARDTYLPDIAHPLPHALNTKALQRPWPSLNVVRAAGEAAAMPEDGAQTFSLAWYFSVLLSSLAFPFIWVWRSLGKLAEDVEHSSAPQMPGQKQPLWRTIWDFSRPHTLIGSALCVPALHTFAAPSLEAALSPLAVGSWLAAILPSLLINIYVTGLNQITDVEIDRVNKPYLPIASGALSLRAAIVVVTVCLAMGLTMVPLLYTQVACLQPYATAALQTTLVGSVLLGTIYSLPPLRLKRFPVLAATCILAVRGALINVGFYAHALSAVFGGFDGPIWTLPLRDIRCGAAALFFVVFGMIIALMKDVPDLRGDRLAGIRTFTVRLGPAAMFRFTTIMLAILFGGFAGLLTGTGVLGVANGFQQLTWVRGALAAIMLFVAGKVLVDAEKVNPEDSKSVYKYYMFLWKLFYLSYLALPFVR